MEQPDARPPRGEQPGGSGRLQRAVTAPCGADLECPHTALLLVAEARGAGRHPSPRARELMNGSDDPTIDVGAGLDYIRAHPKVTDVLLTGGDPLVISTQRILEVIAALREIPHVSIIRIGTRMPSLNPWRVLDDPELVEGLSRHSTRTRRIYVITHFEHPRELTGPARRGLDALIRAGVICVNQNPLIRGINDDPNVLAELYRRLSFIGVPPCYLLLARPAVGESSRAVAIVDGYQIFEAAKRQLSGLAKRARLAMSHESGLIEIVGVDDRYIYLRYHLARDPADEGRFFVRRRDDQASWLDGLEHAELSGEASKGEATGRS